MQKSVSSIIRIRPVLPMGKALDAREKFQPLALRRIGNNGVQIVEEKEDKSITRASTFSFDHVFDMDSTQFDVYEESVAELVDSAILGHDAIIMAYGQTGSGKTYTMIGNVSSNPFSKDLLTSESGIFLRVLADLMDYKERLMHQGRHVVVGISCIEIYIDRIRDLFGTDSPHSELPVIKPIMIEDHVYLPDITIREVSSIQSVYTEIRVAIARRQSRATEINPTSSRSHCIFNLDIMQQAGSTPPLISLLHEMNKGRNSSIKIQSGKDAFHGSILSIPGQAEPILHSRIMLADLGGSEKVKKSGVSGIGFAEATSINSSLTSMGNVLHALYTGDLPIYRTSNLTRLLRPGLSHPTLQFLLLAHVAPTQFTFDESASTMHFANKVKGMKIEHSRNVAFDTLPLAYLQSLRLNLNLSTDLNLFALECGTRLTLTEEAVSLRDKDFFAATTLPTGPEDELASLRVRGALEASQRVRDQVVTEARGRVEALLPELQYIVDDEHARAVKLYLEELKETQEEVSALQPNDEDSIIDMKLIMAHEAHSREQIKGNEKDFWKKIIDNICGSYLRITRQELQSVRAELERLEDLREGVENNEERRVILSQLQGDSALYAKQCLRHVEGRRCVNLVRYARALRARELALLQNIFIYLQIPKTA